MKTCRKTYPEKTLKLSTVIVKTVTSILKSIALNVCIFVVGVAVGYGAFYVKLQKDILAYDNDECIQLIEDKVNEIAELDEQYIQNQKEIKELLLKIQMSLLAK